MKLVNVLVQVKDILNQEGEREFAELKRRTKRQIFDLVSESASDYDTDGDKDGTSAWFSFPGTDAEILFFSSSEYSDLDSIREDLTDMYVDDRQSKDTVAAIDNLIAELSKPLTVINLTPHEIVVVGEDAAVVARFPASGTTARVNSRAVDLEPVAGVPVVRTEYGDFDGLPDPAPNTIYLVSIIVAQALRKPRPDVYVPDTGPASVVRDNEGKIIGVRRLMQI